MVAVRLLLVLYSESCRNISGTPVRFSVATLALGHSGHLHVVFLRPETRGLVGCAGSIFRLFTFCFARLMLPLAAAVTKLAAGHRRWTWASFANWLSVCYIRTQVFFRKQIASEAVLPQVFSSASYLSTADRFFESYSRDCCLLPVPCALWRVGGRTSFFFVYNHRSIITLFLESKPCARRSGTTWRRTRGTHTPSQNHPNRGLESSLVLPPGDEANLATMRVMKVFSSLSDYLLWAGRVFHGDTRLSPFP
ncbi:hypothetical protein C8R46DRAFT_93009 [Mycena filopes]|nr:hypothetical protein C8R46DRAFT_93009 [Mycena filopes]